MNYFYLGIYWFERSLTLRQYADASKAFLLELARIHPVFQSLSWVGDRPNSAIEVSPGLGNLEELISRHAGSKGNMYELANPDGTPSWLSTSIFGYSMRYNTGRPASAGGVGVSIHAGSYKCRTPNSVTVSFPAIVDERGFHRELYDYAFLKNLFCKAVALWAPMEGLITQHSFSDAITDERLPYVGWLTYLRDPRAAALRHSTDLRDLIFDQPPDGGTLISLDTTIISPDNSAQVEKARRLRSLLIAEKLV
ncbi:hypothetical protein H3H36_11540 [Duganella sp. FT3S]|uniref:Immunity protein 52 domain-containing protein n=1 Tax=Rugamonas fusca TaxID=2758568 RepID=A0A7W2EHG2_9BURK|nr:Imm52 family immunity protein [Rugamonas fusca]MBA5605993.1 hypothetical protein [Rugamonas fusca]